MSEPALERGRRGDGERSGREPRRQEALSRESGRRDAEAETQNFLAVVEASADLVGLADLDGRTIYVNASGLDLLGLRDFEEARGRPIAEYCTPETLELLEHDVLPRVMAGERVRIEWTLRHQQTSEPIAADAVVFLVGDPTTAAPAAIATVQRDIRAQKQREAERADLLQRERQARVEAERRAVAAHALQSIGEGVVVVDEDGAVRLWNAGAEAITGIAERTIVGERLEDVVPGWRDIADRVPVGGQPGSSTPRTLPLAIDDRELWLSVSGSRFDGGAVYTFRDVGKELELDRLTADVIATVSHELRTPLAAVYGAAVTLRRPDVPLTAERRAEFLEMIEKQTDRLARIVEQTLLASRLGAQELPLERKPVDPRQLVRDAVQQVVGSADAAAIEIVETRVPERVVADGHKVVQVLRNLIENALKYSKKGGRVEVRIDGDERRLRFAVRDDGIGIPAEEQERIFDKFYRVDPSMSSGVGGAGLGLYVCRELLQRMNGRIWVESTPGAGSTFAIELPVERP